MAHGKASIVREILVISAIITRAKVIRNLLRVTVGGALKVSKHK